MGITERQRAERSGYIGASDAPTIMGLTPSTATDLWLRKTGQAPPVEETASIKFGNLIEPGMIDDCRKIFGPLKSNVARRLKGTPFKCHIDAQVVADGTPIEIKSTGLNGPVYGHWGDAETDDVPPWVWCQVQFQLMVTQQPMGWVYAAIGGRGCIFFKINADSEYQELMAERCHQFFTYVENGVAPPDEMISPEIAKLIDREPEKTAPGSLVNVQRWRALKDRRSRIDRLVKRCEKRIFGQLGDAEVLQLPDGSQVTYRGTYRKAYTIPEKFVRVLRYKKPPKGTNNE